MANKPVRINGILYPSQEWYEENVAKKQQSVNIENIQKQLGEIKTKTESLIQKASGVLPAEQLQKIPGIDLTKINQPVDIKDDLYKIKTQADVNLAKANSWDEFRKALQERTEVQTQQKEELQKEQATIWEKLKGLLTTKPSTQALLEEEQKKWGIPEMYQQIQALVPEITTLREELNRLDAKEMELQDRLMNEPLPSWLISRRQSALQQEYNRNRAVISSELATKVALMNALQGNITTANSLAESAIKMATYDTEQELNRYATLYSLYGDQIKQLDDDIQNAINSQFQMWQQKHQEEKEDLQNKMSLLTTAAQNGYVPDLSMDDIKNMDYSELLKMVAPYIKEEAAAEEPLSVSDILNLNAAYGVNLLPGMTAGQAAAEIQRVLGGKLTPEEAKASVSNYIQTQTQNTGKEPKKSEVLEWINNQNWSEEAKQSARDFVNNVVYPTEKGKTTFLQRLKSRLGLGKETPTTSLVVPTTGTGKTTTEQKTPEQTIIPGTSFTEEGTIPLPPEGSEDLFTDYINKILPEQITLFNYEYTGK